MDTHILILDGIPLGRRVKLARVAKDLRQGDVAFLATRWVQQNLPFHQFKVQPDDVGYLERGWNIPVHRKRAILAVLGLQDEP